ncbi:MAG: extracellular solute-binding protein [Oscillospiraceae bacterium]|nr:extracellular solute-binding protein [Oscillospiraceae bacterium]
MKKRFLSLLCAAVLCTMAGCGGTPSSSAAPSNSSTPSANSSSAGKEASATSNGQTTLNILWWGSQTRHDLTTKMLEKFQELNPDIEVVMDYSDWGGYWTKLPAQVAGGQTPDVFQMDYAYLSQYANNGVLAELDSYIADGSLNMSDVAENIIKSGSVNGKVYAISTGTNAPVMLYRNDILEELNLSLPMNPTMSEYTAVSKAVYEATGLRDTFIVDCSDVIFRQHLRNYGLNLYNDDATALGFDDPKYLVNMWKLALQAQEEGWGLMPGEGTAVSAFDSMVMDAWSRFQNSNELQAYRDSTGKDIRMVMLPSMDDGTTPATFLKPAMFWCVGADSNVKDAAIRFIDFFTNSPECFDIVGIERAVPISSKMREYVTPSLDEVGKEVVQFIDYVSQPDKSSPLMNADPEVHQTIGELMSQYSEQVRYGELTDLEAAAKQFMEEANKIIADGVKAE